MAEEIISLTSSDEEDNSEPPLKRIKPTPVLPECTLTVVNSKQNLQQTKASRPITTVNLDSDEETSELENNPLATTIKKTKSILSKSDPSENVETDTPVNVSKVNGNVDLITLLDDDEETPHNDRFNQKESTMGNGILESILDSDKRKKSVANGHSETLISLCTKKSAPFPAVNQSTTVSIDDSDSDAEDEVEETKDNSVEEKTEEFKHEKSNDSIVINDTDEETEKENHCENENVDTFAVNVDKTSTADPVPSTSKDDTAEAKALFKKFLNMVEEKIVDSSFEEIFPKKAPIIQKYFHRSGCYVNDKIFETVLKEAMESIKKSTTSNGANHAVLAFHKVFEHLKSNVAANTIVIEEDDLPKVKKLEKTLKLLRKRIKQLEEAEVNFEDDDDSTYIQLDRYQSRLNKVYAKYCQYIKRNPYSGRATYDRITFVNSSYNQINQALTKKYKNSLVFPSYYELEKFIKKVVDKEKLNLSENDIKSECKKCFKALGSILQKKRRQELYDSHISFIEFTEDPASKDISLENTLKKNFVEGEEKIEKICQKYVFKQEKGEDKVSTDQESSDEENLEMKEIEQKNMKEQEKEKCLDNREDSEEANKRKMDSKVNSEVEKNMEELRKENTS